MTSLKNKTPVASWLDYDFLAEEQRAVKCLTVILRTRGCQWRKCRMCGFWHESADASLTQADLLTQLEQALERHSPDEDFILKIFTSGSFLDEREISGETRRKIAETVRRRRRQGRTKGRRRGGIKKLLVETRPEFVSEEKIKDLKVVEGLELAFGLETADDFIRSNYINKGFSFEDFRNAAKVAKKSGASVKTYLLLKPPFVSEKKAIQDAVKSADLVAPYSSTISLNLCNVQRQTALEGLWRRKFYRPPWLWSAVEVLKTVKRKRGEGLVLLSDPVGGGHKRGPHNCGKCDAAVVRAIKKFNRTQDLSVLERLDESEATTAETAAEAECECKGVWCALLKFDDFLFGSNPPSSTLP